MTYDDAVTVTGMLINAFPNDRDWTTDQITWYAKGIERLDAEHATKAVLRAQATMQRRPDVAALISITKVIEAQAISSRPAGPQPKPKPVPLWVKRWVCARHLHRRFDRDQDMRRFAEQGDWPHPDIPLMPPDEWVREAQLLGDRAARRAFAP